MLRRFWCISLLLLIVLTGCSSYDVVREGSQNYPPISPIPTEKKKELTLYFPDKDMTQLVKERRVVEVKKQGEAEIIVNELLRGPEDEELQLQSLIPKGTKLLSIDIKAGTAFVSFSRQLLERNYSEREEVLTLYSIVNSLTQLDSIDTVQILVEGKIEDVFHNHISLSNSKEFSKLIVEDEYLSPFGLLEEFYNSIEQRDYGRMMSLLSLNKIGILTPSFNEEYSNTDEIEIINYVIDQYGYDSEGRTIVRVDISLDYGGTGKIKEDYYELVVDNGRFKIYQIGRSEELQEEQENQKKQNE